MILEEVDNLINQQQYQIQPPPVITPPFVAPQQQRPKSQVPVFLGGAGTVLGAMLAKDLIKSYIGRRTNIPIPVRKPAVPSPWV